MWDDAGADWAAYDLVVVRSTWDSVDRPTAFLAWVDAVAKVTRIENPAAALAWNLDKRYLVDLERAGLPVVPTTWGGPGRSVDAAARTVRGEAGDLGWRP